MQQTTPHHKFLKGGTRVVLYLNMTVTQELVVLHKTPSMFCKFPADALT